MALWDKHGGQWGQRDAKLQCKTFKLGTGLTERYPQNKTNISSLRYEVPSFDSRELKEKTDAA